MTALHTVGIPLHPHVHRVTGKIASFDLSITRSEQSRNTDKLSCAGAPPF